MENFFLDHGMILRSEPIGEYDRRLVILTKDHGKISAFARGARRQNNRLTASTDLFCFGEYKLYAGQNSYSVSDATIKNYFEELRNDMVGALYGMYFLEVMDYFTRENNDEELMLRLLYQALRAIIKPEPDNKLVKAVFELKTMLLQGECKYEFDDVIDDAAKYAVNYVISTKPDKLFTFNLKDKALKDFISFTEIRKKQLWNNDFVSENMLEMIEKA